jgi:serine/threonine protein kinase
VVPAPCGRIGSYIIVGPLGAGGIGEVYKVKFLHTTRATDPSFRDRFEREARTVAVLTHPTSSRSTPSRNTTVCRF